MAEGKKPRFGVIQGGRPEPAQPSIRAPEARLLEEEMRQARESLRQSLNRAPTNEEVRRHALTLSADRFGEQSRARNDTPEDPAGSS